MAVRTGATALQHFIGALLCYPLVGGDPKDFGKLLERAGRMIASAPLQDGIRMDALAWVQLFADLTARYGHYSMTVVWAEIEAHPILREYLQSLPMLAELEPCWQVAEYWARVLVSRKKVEGKTDGRDS